jgi:hypothetical protein
MPVATSSTPGLIRKEIRLNAAEGFGSGIGERKRSSSWSGRILFGRTIFGGIFMPIEL